MTNEYRKKQQAKKSGIPFHMVHRSHVSGFGRYVRAWAKKQHIEELKMAALRFKDDLYSK